MAGSPEQSGDYKFANAVEKKSYIVGAVALVFGVVPIVLWEAAQIYGAHEYKENKKRGGTIVDFLTRRKRKTAQ